MEVGDRVKVTIRKPIDGELVASDGRRYELDTFNVEYTGKVRNVWLTMVRVDLDDEFESGKADGETRLFSRSECEFEPLNETEEP